MALARRARLVRRHNSAAPRDQDGPAPARQPARRHASRLPHPSHQHDRVTCLARRPLATALDEHRPEVSRGQGPAQRCAAGEQACPRSCREGNGASSPRTRGSAEVRRLHLAECRDRVGRLALRPALVDLEEQQRLRDPLATGKSKSRHSIVRPPTTWPHGKPDVPERLALAAELQPVVDRVAVAECDTGMPSATMAAANSRVRHARPWSARSRNSADQGLMSTPGSARTGRTAARSAMPVVDAARGRPCGGP